MAPAFYVFGLVLLVIVLIPGIGLEDQRPTRVDQGSRHRSVSTVGVCKSHDGDDARALLRQDTGRKHLTLKEMIASAG